MMVFRNLFRNSDFGLVINWNFHRKNRWMCALSPYLINAIVREFNPYIITTQREYELLKKKLKCIIAAEPGWSGPKIKYDTKQDHTIAVFVSDPHSKATWLPAYVQENNIQYVFSYYYHPFFYHMPDFSRRKLIHMPWAVPESLIVSSKVTFSSGDVVIFGGGGSPAYDVRNWCRQQDGIINFDNSGVENKKLSNKEYFTWLAGFNAVVAAGSSNPMYDLVTPKYFEIAAAGALLIGQHCRDLELLGFNESNCIIFTQKDFAEKIRAYKQNPSSYKATREKGRELIRNRHTISHRIRQIQEVFGCRP